MKPRTDLLTGSGYFDGSIKKKYKFFETGYPLLVNKSKYLIEIYFDVTDVDYFAIQPYGELELPKVLEREFIHIKGPAGAILKIYIAQKPWGASLSNSKHNESVSGDYYAIDFTVPEFLEVDIFTTLGRYGKKVGFICPGFDVDIRIKLKDDDTAVGAVDAITVPAGTPFAFPFGDDVAEIDQIRMEKTGDTSNQVSGAVY